MKLSMSLMFAFALVSSYSAHAEDGVWADAFPDAPVSSTQSLIGANEMVGAVALNTNVLMHPSLDASLEKKALEEYQKKALFIVVDSEGTPADIKQLLMDRGRADRLEEIASSRGLSSAQQKQLDAYKKSFEAAPERMKVAEALVESKRQELLAGSKVYMGMRKVDGKMVPEWVNAEEAANRNIRKIHLVKGAAIAAGVALVADGGARILLSLSHRDPGYSPAVSGSIVAAKVAAPKIHEMANVSGVSGISTSMDPSN